MADKRPMLWLQLYEDKLLADEKAEKRPGWLEPGEKAEDARDRLRKEREEAKRRLEERRDVHD